MIGEILKERTYILRVHVGTAKNSKTAYEMSTNAGNGAPIVQSKQTGKWFTLSWTEIINMAVDAGIDKKEEKENAKSKSTNRQKNQRTKRGSRKASAK